MACLHCDLELSCSAVTSLQIHPLGPASSSSAAGLLSGLAPGTGQHPEGGARPPAKKPTEAPVLLLARPVASRACEQRPPTFCIYERAWPQRQEILSWTDWGQDIRGVAFGRKVPPSDGRFVTKPFSFLHCLIGLREAGSSNQIQRLLDWQWSGATPVSPQPYHACANTPS